MKLFFFILVIFNSSLLASSYITEDGTVIDDDQEVSKKHSISQRKWYQSQDSSPKYIFLNIGYHKYLNGFCHNGGVSLRKVLEVKSHQFNLTKHHCLSFNGNNQNETFFLLKTKDRHYLKIAQCTQKKRLASLAYSIAYDYKSIKSVDDKIQKYCGDEKNRKPLLFDSKKNLNSVISKQECMTLISFVYNSLSESSWPDYHCRL